MSKVENLQKACEILGLDYKEYASIPEVEKGIVDYKAAYEEQKALNEKILLNIGEVSKSFDNKFQKFRDDFDSNVIKELKKSIEDLGKEVNTMKTSPMRNAKSATAVKVIEKSIGQSNKRNENTYDLQNFSDLKKLKSYLGDKAISDLQKGIQNSIYEKAALQLDARKRLSPDLISILSKDDNITIIQ